MSEVSSFSLFSFAVPIVLPYIYIESNCNKNQRDCYSKEAKWERTRIITVAINKRKVKAIEKWQKRKNNREEMRREKQ